ncbi:hypothetical protein KJ359_011942 [Pestalotiopsis sp. 9143b]|nr:hypothetical protein KJ359_011942 [Pestalotiopsis sp. 9143b]
MEQQHNSATDAAPQSGEPNTSANLAAPANLTSPGTIATPASLAVPTLQQQQLNEARRPQRLYHKVKVAMKLANKRISDRRFTEIGHFLSDEKLAEFKQEVRVQIRRRLDETIDSWPIRTYHDYRPDIRVAIDKAMEAKWDLFDCGEDEFVPSELLLAPFYDE